MFELLKVGKSEARKRIVIAGWGLKAKGPAGFLQLEDLLGKGSIDEPENFDGPLCHETTLLCYSSGTTGKPKGVEVRSTLSGIYRRHAHYSLQDYASESCYLFKHDSVCVPNKTRRGRDYRCLAFLPHLRYVSCLIKIKHVYEEPPCRCHESPSSVHITRRSSRCDAPF